MEENKNESNLYKTYKNLFIRAERAGKIKFENEQNRENLINEYTERRKQYYDLLSKARRAKEKSEQSYRQGKSKEWQKKIKAEIKEGQKELKMLNKEIKQQKKLIDEENKLFDLPEVGGKEGYENMLSRAHDDDIKEAKEAAKRKRSGNSFISKGNVNVQEAIYKANDKANDKAKTEINNKNGPTMVD